MDSYDKVLLVEDKEYNMLFLQEALANYPLQLISAYDGLEAIEKVKENPDIKLVLMDVKMPKLDGYQSAKIIREYNSEIKIIAQTAYALEQEIEHFSDSFDEYLIKPISKDKLARVISKYVNI
ncbi:MAG: response regulator [Bacteroidales bacterium]|nr:response regulator [Bacteroidales bacterium]